MTKKCVTDNVLCSFLDEIVDMVEDKFSDLKTDSFGPYLFISDTTKKNINMDVYSVVTPDLDSGLTTLYCFGEHFRDKGVMPNLAAIVGEAWAVDDKDPDCETRPSCHPDRKEIIIVSGMTIDGKSTKAEFKIARDEENNIVLHPPRKFYRESPCSNVEETSFVRAFFEGLKNKRSRDN